jgi:hypothetical protein
MQFRSPNQWETVLLGYWSDKRLFAREFAPKVFPYRRLIWPSGTLPWHDLIENVYRPGLASGLFYSFRLIIPARALIRTGNAQYFDESLRALACGYLAPRTISLQALIVSFHPIPC